MHGIGLEMASKPSSGTPKGALEGLCGWRIEATWAFDEAYAAFAWSEGRFRARTQFAGHFRADSVHDVLSRTVCRAARRVESHGGAHRAMRRPARCDVPRRESRALRVRRVLPRCAALRAPRSVDPSHCVPHIPPPRCVLRAQRTCRVASRLVARRSPHPADLSRTSRSADLSRPAPRPATERCALPACVATAQSTVRSSRRPSRSGCPRSR